MAHVRSLADPPRCVVATGIRRLTTTEMAAEGPGGAPAGRAPWRPRRCGLEDASDAVLEEPTIVAFEDRLSHGGGGGGVVQLTEERRGGPNRLLGAGRGLAPLATGRPPGVVYSVCCFYPAGIANRPME